MEFRFRAIDDRRQPCRSSPSPFPSLNCFSDQAFGVNNTMDPNHMHNPRCFYTIQRQMERERIRHEIIMAENVHRRLLEEEVWRELMMEREMAKASEMGPSIDERFPMLLPGNRGLGFGHEAPSHPFPHFSDASKAEIRSALEVNKKDKLIMLAKPDPNLSGAKRKATTPPAGSGEFPLMSSKKPKEWSCALCEVSATDERGLNQHLQGKKHKAKVAGLIRAQRICNHSTSPMSKKSRKKIKLTESGESADQQIKTEVEEEAVDANKLLVGLDLKMEGGEDLENKNEEPPKKDLNANPQMKKNCILNEEKPKRKLPNGKKFKFWCEVCQVGTYSAVVMEDHIRGKKHMTHHNESKPNDTAVPTTNCVTILAPFGPTEKAEDDEVVAEKRNVDTLKIVTEKSEDEEAAANEASEETTENVMEKAKDEDVVSKEANEETVENVSGDSGRKGPSILADVVDPTQQAP